MLLVRRRCCTQHCCPWPCCCTRHRPTAIWPLTVWSRQRWRFCSIALVSSPALHGHHCQHQAVLVAGVVPALLPSWPSKVRPVPCWRLLALRWRFARIALASLPALCCCPCCRHCAGVIALVAWALLPLLHGRFSPCCAGIVALVAFASLPALQTGGCPITKQLQHALASLPGSCHHCCRRSAGIVALIPRASLPSLRWRHCP
jgi:hypothetical protein